MKALVAILLVVWGASFAEAQGRRGGDSQEFYVIGEWVGGRTQVIELDQMVEAITIEATMGRSEIEVLELRTDEGRRVNLIYLLNNDNVATEGPYDLEKKILLNEPVYATELHIELESWTRGSGQSEVLVSLQGRGGPARGGCQSQVGPVREGENAWVPARRDSEIVESVECRFGGDKVEIFERLVEKTCRAGSMEKTGRSRKGDLLRTEGQCKQRSRRSCQTREGLVGHGERWWVPVQGQPIRESVACEFGGGQETEVYQRLKQRRCDDGQKMDTGREKKGRHLRTKGQCRAPKKCGRHEHGSRWTKDTGRTEEGVQACNNNRGEQDVVLKLLRVKTCYDGEVSKGPIEKEVLSAGQCITQCGRAFGHNNGVSQSRGGRSNEGIRFVALPGNTMPGTEHTATCGQLAGQNAKDAANPNKVVTFVCNANGNWQKAWARGPACKTGSRGR